MGEIKDFKCTYDNSAGISREVTEGLDLKFPDAYLYWEPMAELSLALKRHDGANFCELPFDHAVEGEAMGAHVNYGNENAGPRAKDYICTSPEQILELPEIDLEKGRIHEVLLACRELRRRGEDVVLEASGPFTVMNMLIDPKYVFKAMRKKPELVQKVFRKIGNDVLRYMEAAQEYGARLISYADSSGGVNILGPKMAEQVVELFTYDYMKKIDKIIRDDTMVLLCPKTTLALLGTDRAELADHQLSGPMKYGEACVEMLGKVKFAGQMCIKNINYVVSDGIFKEVVIK